MNRRSFIKGTGVGTLALTTGVSGSAADLLTSLSADRLGKPFPRWKIDYWHAHMLDFLLEHGQRDSKPMPKEPDWRLVEQGRLKWNPVMPFPFIAYKDVAHIDGKVSACTYGFSEVEMSFGRVRADFFAKESANPVARKLLGIETLCIVTVNGSLLGYSGYVTKPENISLNYEGFPFRGRLLKVWTPPMERLATAIMPCNLWEKV